jgi:hypothetical protein
VMAANKVAEEIQAALNAGTAAKPGKRPARSSNAEPRHALVA